MSILKANHEPITNSNSCSADQYIGMLNNKCRIYDSEHVIREYINLRVPINIAILHKRDNNKRMVFGPIFKEKKHLRITNNHCKSL